uniref:A disintegrin and metalloproteinase with thrombospondin motifs 14 n=1 Tax=Magallana gigas TaxID=29159 RepID=K1QPJ0_MAGGI
MAEDARRKESAKTLDNCESIIEDATKSLQENNMRHAYMHLAKVLLKDHRSKKHKDMERKALDIVITSLGKSLTPEIPNELVKIPNKLYEQIINGLAASEKWRQMYFIVKEHRRHYGDLSLPNFAKSMSLAKVIRHSSFQDSEQLLIDVLKSHVSFLSCVHLSACESTNGKLPILAAVQECQFKVLEVLLKWGANPVHLTINHGDTPIHAALSIALERDKVNGGWGTWGQFTPCGKSCGGGIQIRFRSCDHPSPSNGGLSCIGDSLQTASCNSQQCPGNFSILKYSYDLYEKDPNKYPMLDPAQTNSEGDSLFHLVAKANYCATTMKAAKFLCDKKVNASVLNKEGKLPKDYLNSKNDKRLQMPTKGKQVVEKPYEEAEEQYKEKEGLQVIQMMPQIRDKQCV